MGLRTYLQDHPGGLVGMWRLTEWLLERMRGSFERMGFEKSSRRVRRIEEPVKHLLFDCRMCGQCVLHSTGMTCPMTCPKQLRNGPCGGVQQDLTCEVPPHPPCVWLQAVERAMRTPYRDELTRINPPVDWQLEWEASWVTFATGRDLVTIGDEPGILCMEEPIQWR